MDSSAKLVCSMLNCWLYSCSRLVLVQPLLFKHLR